MPASSSDSASFSSVPSTRRSLLRKAALLGVLSSALRPEASGQPTPVPSSAGPDFCLFTKHLLGMEPDALADQVASLGFAGIEAPIRPGGHVLPENVPDALPAFHESLKKAGLKLTILTSAINAVSKEQHTESVLRTAAALGIRFYRLNWFQYDLKRPLLPQLAEIRAKMKDLLALSRELGIRPLSQNHNGPRYVGAPIWDLASLMRDFPVGDWGFAYDIMHAAVVGGTSWEINYRLARPHIGAAYFKDFTWAGKLKPATCPLGVGFAPAAEYAGLLRETDFSGPVSLHIEYLKAVTIKTPEEARLAHDAGARDFARLREWWSA